MCLSWRSDTELPSPVAAEVLEKLAAAGWNRVVFTGGEVVVSADFRPLLKLATSLGLKVGVVTNGTVFSEPHSRYLEFASLDYLVYSRDLARASAHAKLRVLPQFDHDMMGALPSLRQRGVFLQVNTVLFPGGVGELHALAASPMLRMFDRWHVMPVKGAMAAAWDESRRAEAISAFRLLEGEAPGIEVIVPDPEVFARIPLDDLRLGHYTAAAFEEGRYCKAQETLLYVDATGEALPCNSILWEQRGRATYGNVRTVSLDAILQRKTEQCARKLPVSAAACASCDPLNVARHLHAGTRGTP